MFFHVFTGRSVCHHNTFDVLLLQLGNQLLITWTTSSSILIGRDFQLVRRRRKWWIF